MQSVERSKFLFLAALLYTGRLNAAANLDIQRWLSRVRSGDPRSLARAISIVENRVPGWSDLLKVLFPHTGKARVIGLTGAPGAGKSTLVDQLARHYRNIKNPHSSRRERGLNGAPTSIPT